MLFNSYIFVLTFLPVCITGYFVLNYFNLKTLGQAFLLGMSLWFYGYFNVKYLWIIIASIGFNYIFYILLSKILQQRKRKWPFFAAMALNIGILFYFKYFNFFLENVNAIFAQEFAVQKILLPLGISFFTFQQISFVIDTYKGEVPQYSFLYYASFVTFFPQLIAGPIVTHDELIPQFMDDTRKHFQWENFVKGVYLFTLGLGKKLLIADTFGNAVNWGFSNMEMLDSTNAILIMFFYTIQIYFDFSGYCDMALGLGKMFNIDLPLNFDSPYKALTIVEFWKRWHKTLTRFFTKYIYIPLGGSRKGVGRTYINIMIIFLVSGLWHGANWTFILWGACHGMFSIIIRRYEKQFEKIPKILQWIVTFLFLNITWIIFRADSVSDAGYLFSRIISCEFGRVSSNISECFNLPECLVIDSIFNILNVFPEFFLVVFTILAMLLLFGTKNAYEKMKEFSPTVMKLITTIILLVWCLFSFSSVSTFLYFNF